MNRAVVAQYAAGFLLGGIFLWVLGEYGWESPKTIWAVIVAALLVLAVNLGELRARIAKIEKNASGPQ